MSLGLIVLASSALFLFNRAHYLSRDRLLLRVERVHVNRKYTRVYTDADTQRVLFEFIRGITFNRNGSASLISVTYLCVSPPVNVLLRRGESVYRNRYRRDFIHHVG